MINMSIIDFIVAVVVVILNAITFCALIAGIALGLMALIDWINDKYQRYKNKK